MGDGRLRMANGRNLVVVMARQLVLHAGGGFVRQDFWFCRVCTSDLIGLRSTSGALSLSVRCTAILRRDCTDETIYLSMPRKPDGLPAWRRHPCAGKVLLGASNVSMRVCLVHKWLVGINVDEWIERQGGKR